MVQDTNPSYWSEYTNLQHVKHALIREYLKGWFPKLGFWSGRIVYLDTHGEVMFFLIEHDPENVDLLRAEVVALGKLPAKVQVPISCDDCFTQMERILSNLEEKGKKIAPAFVFVDPYGFKVPGDLVRRLLAAGRVEVFVNIIWRELDMAMALARHQSDGGMVETLNLVFGGERWREIGGLSFDVRADRAVDLLRVRRPMGEVHANAR